MSTVNRSLFDIIFSLSHRSAFFDDAMVFLAGFLPFLLVIGFFAAIFLLFNDWRRRILFFSGVLLAVLLSRGIIAEALRFLVPTIRPFLALDIEPLVRASSAAFPSGHASFFFALSTVIFYFNRRWGGWFYVLSVLNGLARVVAGIHWPFDIAGGAAVGILSGIFVYHLIEPYFKEIQPQHVLKSNTAP